MRRSVAALVLAIAPVGARAQLGEVQVGAIGTWGVAEVHGPGVGVVGGVAAGRIIYVGGRAVWQFGSGTTRGQLFAVDGGILFPLGPFEIVPGVTLGWMRYEQGVAGARVATMRFVSAPSLAVHVRLAGLVLIPEALYVTALDHGLPQPATHQGFVGAVRLVVPIEVNRIRY